MSQRPFRVLKYGGSVLQGAASLPGVVQDIYRAWREGNTPIAVVSAFEGRTDALLASAPSLQSPHDLALHLAAGERETALALAEALAAAGLPWAILDPLEIPLIAAGPPLAARLQSLDGRAFEAVRAEGGIAIVPGFFARDAAGRCVTLGRGGSDATALFLGQTLPGARCELVKDVPGLFDRDPRAEGPSPARLFAEVDAETALRHAGPALQPEALIAARDSGQRFTVRALLAQTGTEIGPLPTRFAAAVPIERPTLRVGLLGFGAVGSAFARTLISVFPQASIEVILVRDPLRHATLVPSLASRFTNDLAAIQAASCDVIVEALGGIEPAHALIAAALARGQHVVSANKELLAAKGQALELAARSTGAKLAFSAAVGGALPVLETLTRNAPSEVRAVWNGTTNAVLEAERLGKTFEEALAHACASGQAEADPTRDLSGRDAWDKARLVARTLGLRCQAEAPRLEWPKRQPPPGHRWRQVVTLSAAEVALGFQAVGPEDPLFELPGASNALTYRDVDDRLYILRAQGAGGPPTALSLLADVLDLRAGEALARTAPERRVECLR